jgi:15-cis-phytoene synthase
MVTAEPTPESISADYAHCDALLRRDDPDRWLACLFLPADLRPHVQALYAFNLEIARVRELVSEPMLGEIRFQWWREALAGERQSEAEAHPVAAALLDTMAKFALPGDRFSALIDARLFDLHDAPMPSLAVLEAYAKATSAGLFHLARQIVAPADSGLTAAADHAGIAYAVTGLLRALPWHVANGQIYVPVESLQTHGSGIAEFETRQASVGLLKTLADLRQLVRDHLRACKELAAASTSKGRVVLLPASLCDAYLRQMEKPGYAPFQTRIALPQWRRQWILWRAARAMG